MAEAETVETPSENAAQWEDPAREDDLLPELGAFLDLLRRRCAVDFSGYKTSTLSRRIRQRMAHTLKLKVIDEAQGYYYARPLQASH